jgi:hypothetical protein
MRSDFDGGMQRGTRREAYRGTSDPGYLNYTIGKLEILKLREDYKKAMGAKFSLTEFHDRFLAAGVQSRRHCISPAMDGGGELPRGRTPGQTSK